MHAAIDDARVMLASFLCLRGASLVLLSRGPIVRRGLPARGMPGIDVVVCVGDLRDGDLHVVMGGNVREARAECLDEIVVFIGEALLVCVVLDGASGHEALHETTQVHVEPHAHTSANHVSGELLEPLCEKRAVLCCEVGSGVIPIDYETRLGREAVGRLCVRLAQRAECVVRMVCGIPTVIKGELPCRSI